MRGRGYGFVRAQPQPQPQPRAPCKRARAAQRRDATRAAVQPATREDRRRNALQRADPADDAHIRPSAHCEDGDTAPRTGAAQRLNRGRNARGIGGALR